MLKPTFAGYICYLHNVTPELFNSLLSELKGSGDMDAVIEDIPNLLNDLICLINHEDKSDNYANNYLWTDERYKRLQELKTMYDKYMSGVDK